ncbi:hypothetical protein V3C99_008022 [Haemonchus contortus]
MGRDSPSVLLVATFDADEEDEAEEDDEADASGALKAADASETSCADDAPDVSDTADGFDSVGGICWAGAWVCGKGVAGNIFGISGMSGNCCMGCTWAGGING